MINVDLFRLKTEAKNLPVLKDEFETPIERVFYYNPN